MKSPLLGLIVSALAATAVTSAGHGAARAAELVMFEERGCPWCKRFHEEVAPAHPKTEEGRKAPLRVVDMHAERPADLTFIAGIRAAPTFVLVDGGREVGRITGYPGADFFWGLLADILARLPAAQGSDDVTRCPPAEPALSAVPTRC